MKEKNYIVKGFDKDTLINHRDYFRDDLIIYCDGINEPLIKMKMNNIEYSEAKKEIKQYNKIHDNKLIIKRNIGTRVA